MSPIFFITLFPTIIFALLLVVLIIWAIAKSGKARKGIGIVFAVITFIVLTRLLIFARISRPVIVSQAGNHLAASVPIEDFPAESGPIWSPGMEYEFDADVYPSKLSAVRALGLRIEKPLRKVIGESEPEKILIFLEDSEPALVTELAKAIDRTLSAPKCFIQPGQTDLKQGQVGISLKFVDVESQTAPWSEQTDTTISKGRIEANIVTLSRQATINESFVEKPWFDNFSGFLSSHPKREFIVARSTGSCTSYELADNQALSNACRIVAARLNTFRHPRSPLIKSGFSVIPDDIKQFGFITDSFVQTFSGSVSPIYRKAVLLDMSRDKLQSLANQKFSLLHSQRATWFKMIISLAGIIALICVVYLFLNAATKGYYTWALRIVAIVLTTIFVLILIK